MPDPDIDMPEPSAGRLGAITIVAMILAAFIFGYCGAEWAL